MVDMHPKRTAMIRNAPNDIAIGKDKARSLYESQEQYLKTSQEAQRQREITNNG
jgi:hypothetical protein